MPFTTDQFVISVAAFGNSASHANASETHGDLSDETFSLHLLNTWNLLAQNGLVGSLDSWQLVLQLWTEVSDWWHKTSIDMSWYPHVAETQVHNWHNSCVHVHRADMHVTLQCM